MKRPVFMSLSLAFVATVVTAGSAVAAPATLSVKDTHISYKADAAIPAQPMNLTVTRVVIKKKDLFVLKETLGGTMVLEPGPLSKRCKLYGPKRKRNEARCQVLPSTQPNGDNSFPKWIEVTGSYAADTIDLSKIPAAPPLSEYNVLRGSPVGTPVSTDWDRIFGSDGKDDISGVYSHDQLIGNGGPDFIFDRFGSDLLWGDSADFPATGPVGNDVVDANDAPGPLGGPDYVACGGGNDLWFGDPDDIFEADCGTL